MIVEGIDLASNLSLIGEFNRIKGELLLISESVKKPEKKIYSFPVFKSIFRVYEFPFRDKEKIERAILGNLDLPIDIKDLEFSYISREFEKNKIKVFCVFVNKNDLKGLNKISIVDSEIFALLRLLKRNNIKEGTVIHFHKDYIFVLKFEDLFPTYIKVIGENELENFLTGENIYLSGFIPDSVIDNSTKILNNPTGDTRYNIAYGSLLRVIDTYGIDFLNRDTDVILTKFLKGLIYLFFTVLFIDLAVFINFYVKSLELKKIKEKEREIYFKYFSQSGKVYDPLLQAKGLIKKVKQGSQDSVDVFKLLEDLGKAKKMANIKSFEKIDITNKTFKIEGIAKSLVNVENFKKFLDKKYQLSIEETSTQENGDVKFILKGIFRLF